MRLWGRSSNEGGAQNSETNKTKLTGRKLFSQPHFSWLFIYFAFHSHQRRGVSSLFPQYGLCLVSVAVFRTTVNNADGMRYRNCRSVSWSVNTHSFTPCKRCEWGMRRSETRRGSYVYNNSSSAAIHVQQHFPLQYLCIYNIVSLLWTKHSCSAIHLLCSFFLLLLFSSLLCPCSVAYSLTFTVSCF